MDADIPTDLIEDLLNEYKETFVAMDQDGDGLITKADFERLLFTLNQKPSQEELDDMYSAIDPENQKINFTQFIKLLVVLHRHFDREETLRSVFLCFDRNGDGNLGTSEILYVLKQLGIQVSRQEVEDVVQEQGGCIGFEQFCKVFGRYELQ
uniref:Calmodulin n=1 Tax=Trepomonas sp. PC1 TaxID=1076344 RepID=A0A146K8G1_9EUKA|eukprot:JAP93152.1 Calmodulin [Trepomonas sp. PC1]